MRTLYGNHQQFETTYFKKFPGYYVTGDGKVAWAVCGCGGPRTAIKILQCPGLRIPYRLL